MLNITDLSVRGVVTMNSIGVCLVLVACFWDASALTPEQKSMIQTKLISGGLECIKRHPLSLSEIRSFRNKMLPDMENARCFAACLFKKVGLMNEMGKLDAEKGAANAAKIFKDSGEHVEKTKTFIQGCSKVNDHMVSDGEKGCDRAKLAFDCLKDNAPKYGFDIDF